MDTATSDHATDRYDEAKLPAPSRHSALGIYMSASLLCVLPQLPITAYAANPSTYSPPDGPLMLPQAETIAIDNSPMLGMDADRIAALRAKSVYKAQLADPTIHFGPQNIEAGNYSLDHEAMSMWVVGVSQAFPPWGTLDLHRKQVRATADAATLLRVADSARIRQQVRDAWVNILYYRKVLYVEAREQELLQQVVDAALALYRSGHGDAASNKFPTTRSALNLPRYDRFRDHSQGCAAWER
ncbi:MAG TPA: TolC family protein [Gammaproteobacteria bacterium]|nr:TolC family protein [Gammaproteobacteria bacterium]